VTCVIAGAGDTGFCKNAGIPVVNFAMKAHEFSQSIVDIFNLPKHIVVEDITIWGNDQEVIPL